MNQVKFTELIAKITELTLLLQEERKKRKKLEKKFLRFKIRRNAGMYGDMETYLEGIEKNLEGIYEI